MAGKIELIIREQVILSEASQLDKIASAVASVKIRGHISQSKGANADELETLIENLNAMGDDLSPLMKKNAANVRQIAKEFSAMDKNINAMFKG